MSKLDETVNADHASAVQMADGMPDNIGIFSIKSANETVSEARLQDDPAKLFEEFWFENEVCCLFADTNAGKSILAVQIGEEIAMSGKSVLYFDFELSPKQFQLRYTDCDGITHEFPPNLFRCEIDKNQLDGTDVTGQIIKSIESAAQSAKIIIIDNLTWLCNDNEKGDIAGQFMMFLTRIKRDYSLSIMIISHTPKRPHTMPITMNDLAGSRKLANFFDSIFCIGVSAQDNSLRYLKQIKVRNCAKQYGGDNVCVYQIGKVDSMLKFKFVGYADEREHLKTLSAEEFANIKTDAKNLKDRGLSIRAIGKELGVSKSSVDRYLKNQ